MGDAENNQPSKKRAAGVQLSRDNPGLDDEETPEEEAGTFKKASDEVLATRRIVKVRRQQTPAVQAAEAPAPSSNPFASIRLAPPTSSAVTSEKAEESNVSKETEKQTDESHKQSESSVDEPKDKSTGEEEKSDVPDVNSEQTESKEDDAQSELNTEKDKTHEAVELDASKSAGEKAIDDERSNQENKEPKEGDNIESETKKDAESGKNEDKSNGDSNAEKKEETASFGSFQQLSSSQNAFTGLAGTGFASSTFSFGSTPKDGSTQGSGSGSLFGLKTDQPSFGFGLSNNGTSSIFGSSATGIANKSEGSTFPSMQDVPVETGEENEKAVFTADSALFEYIDGAWKERGKGEIKVNVSTTGTGKARLIMRARGNYRLILNAFLFPDMKLTNMEKKGITFACVNSAAEGKNNLSTFALKFKDASLVEEFRSAVTEHKGKPAVTLKTPENSPKASDE